MPDNHLSILFVDDQRLLLKVVELSIKKLGRNWNVFFAEGPEKAIHVLSENPIDVIVSDMQMPGDRDGIELLEHVKSNYPTTIRFILSGGSDAESTLEAVKIAHQYFHKPTPTAELMEALELTHSLYKRIHDPSLQTLIASIETLPTPRKVYYQINQALSDSSSTIEGIAEIIATDAAIAGKILQIVNSAFFGQAAHIENLKEAVGLLGLNTIRSLVLIAGIASDHSEGLGRYISIDLYSSHCLEVGNLMKKIGAILSPKKEDQDVLFTTGLLHDLGKLILIGAFSEHYRENQWKEDPYTTKLHISEIEEHGDDHAELGAALIALWGISPKVVNSIAFYRNPEQAPQNNRTLPAYLHLAEGLSNYFMHRPDIPFSESGYVSDHCRDILPDVDFDDLAAQLADQDS